MKATGWAATAIGAVVLVGGGIWAATTLPANDEGTVTAVEESQSSEASAEPTESVETPTVEPTEAPLTVDPTPEAEYTEDESGFIYSARQIVTGYLELGDAELLSAGYEICEAIESGEGDLSKIRIPELDALEGTVLHNDVNLTATRYLCPRA